MMTNPWVWFSAAVILAALEVVLPSYVMLGFAGGAAAVGLLLGFGGPLAGWLAGSEIGLLLVFAVTSVLAWLALRRLLSGGVPTARRIDRDINDD